MTTSDRITPADFDRLGIDTVVIAGIDLYGRLIGKRIPARRYPATAAEGLHVCTCVYAWDVNQEMTKLKVHYAGDHTGWHDFRLVPDPATLRVATWLEHTAIVLADSVDEHSDELVEIAPRTILRRSVQQLSTAGYRSFAATELEFHLYHGTPDELRVGDYRDLQPTTRAHADYNITEGDRYEKFFGRVRRVLESSGVPVEVAQVEYGFGQWEINLEYADPVEMADRHALFKHIVRHEAAAYGMTASFMPRPVSDTMGSSCHIHASLRSADGGTVFHDPTAPHGVSELLLQSVGGVLERTPDLMYFYGPTVNSMRRSLSKDFAGNGLTWGFDNRTTTCRVIPGAPAGTRLEMRLPGADVNPYLAVAAVLHSMADGLAAGTDPGPALTGDGFAGDVPDLRRARLPRTLGDAATALRDSAFARAALGDAVVEHYAAVADDEWDSFLLAVTDWERTRYFESI